MSFRSRAVRRPRGASIAGLVGRVGGSLRRVVPNALANACQVAAGFQPHPKMW